MAGRGGQIVFSALMLANDWRRYDRPLLQAAALSGIVAESAWLSRRLIRRRRYDDRLGVWIDCAAAAAALLISQRGIGTRGAAPWAKNVAIGAAIGAASTRSVSDTAGSVGTLCAAAIMTGLRAGGRAHRGIPTLPSPRPGAGPAHDRCGRVRLVRAARAAGRPLVRSSRVSCRRGDGSRNRLARTPEPGAR